MPSELKDNLTLKTRLGHLEEWATMLEQSPLDPTERREKGQERELADKIAILHDDLIEGWKQLLPPGDAADTIEMRPPQVNTDAALAQIDLMRRLLAVENRLARAYGERPPHPITDMVGLDVLITEPAHALLILARNKPSANLDKRIRNILDGRQAGPRLKIVPLI